MEAEKVSDTLIEIRRWCEKLSALPPATTEAEAIDRISALEELSSIAAAAQARETLSFDMLRRNREAVDGVPSRKQGRGVGAEIALARKVSRARGSSLLKFSRTLLMDLPHTYAAMKGGDISEEKARVVAKETAWLPREKRREADQRMADRLAEVGVRRLGNEVRALAQKLDQKAAVDHLERCIEERSVSVRPAPGNMAYLTALLPMPQAVAAFANLTKSAQSLIATGQSQGTSESQLMADLLVERLTGQDSAEAIPTEVHVVMNADSLFEPGAEPAWFPGCGPIPAQAARKFVAENEASVFLRRLYTRPTDGQLVRMDSRRREFSGLLRRMVIIRDDVCRSPWCEARIKHADHAEAVATGGQTGWDNSSGLCAACNYAKELDGWRHEATAEELVVRTPTGHQYRTGTRPIGRTAGEVESDPKLVRGEVLSNSTGPPGHESSEHESSGREPPGHEASGHEAPEHESPGREAEDPPTPGSTEHEGTTAAQLRDAGRAHEEHDPDPKQETAEDQRTERRPLGRQVLPVQVMIPWRVEKQTSAIELSGKTMAVDIWVRKVEPLTPIEERLETQIREFIGSR